MTFERAKIHAIRPNVYLIDDAGESTCYLICGSPEDVVVFVQKSLCLIFMLYRCVDFAIVCMIAGYLLGA